MIPRSLVARLAALALAMIALSAACTATKSDSSEQDARPTTIPTFPRTRAGMVDSITYVLSRRSSSLNEWAPPSEQARCAAEKIAAKVGPDRLLDLGYDPRKGRLDLPYTPDEATAVTNILVGCIDFKAGLLSLMAAYGKLSLDSSACMADGIDRRGLVRPFAESLVTGKQPDPFAEGSQLGPGLSRLLVSCLSDEDLLPVAPTKPFPQDVDTTTTSIPPTTTIGLGGRSTTTTSG